MFFFAKQKDFWRRQIQEFLACSSVSVFFRVQHRYSSFNVFCKDSREELKCVRKPSNLELLKSLVSNGYAKVHVDRILGEFETTNTHCFKAHVKRQVWATQTRRRKLSGSPTLGFSMMP